VEAGASKQASKQASKEASSQATKLLEPKKAKDSIHM